MIRAFFFLPVRFAHYVGIHMEIVPHYIHSYIQCTVYELHSCKVEKQEHNYGWQIIFKLFKW